MTDEPANMNTTQWCSPLRFERDPNIAYVDDYLKAMLAHFADCKIPPTLVFSQMAEALVKVAPGSPYDKLPDEGELMAGLSCLVPAADTFALRVKHYYNAQDRLHANRIAQLAILHNCSHEEAGKIWVASKVNDDPRFLKNGLPNSAAEQPAD